MHINMRPLTNMKDFNAESFCIFPWHWNYKFESAENSAKLFQKIKEAAEGTKKICIAIITDNEDNEFVLGEKDENLGPRFTLFNAVECEDSEGAEVHALPIRSFFAHSEENMKFLKFKEGAIW